MLLFLDAKENKDPPPIFFCDFYDKRKKPSKGFSYIILFSSKESFFWYQFDVF